MFYRLSAYAIAAALFPVVPAFAQGTFPGGIWSDAERTLVVAISPCTPAAVVFCGAIVQDNRPGPATNEAGHQLVRDLKQTRGGWAGKLVDGSTQLNFTMRPQSDQLAQIRFCFGILCDTETWQRVSSVHEPVARLRR